MEDWLLWYIENSPWLIFGAWLLHKLADYLNERRQR